MTEPERSLAQRVYAALLRLFPQEFRGDFGDQMTEDFRDQRQEAASTGTRVAAWRLWTRTTWDVLRSAPREHLDLLWRDLAYAVRRLRRSPMFAVMAVLTLALAIGANTAILSVADAVLFRPLPYRDPDRVFILQNRDRLTGRGSTAMRYDQLQALEAHHSGLGEVGLIAPGPRLAVVTADATETIPTAAVTAGYFRVLDPPLARGRLFIDDDPIGRAALLSYAAWQQRFGGDEQTVGHSVTIGATSFDIIGVLPADFVFPSVFVGRPQLVTLMDGAALGRSGGIFHPVVRLDPHATREQAQAEIDALVTPLGRATPRGGFPIPYLGDVRSVLYPFGRPIMIFMLIASALVLLIGCANLGTLMVARSWRDQTEAAVRTALGASPLRLMRPAICEAILIGLAAAGLALLVVSFTFEQLLPLVPRRVYRAAPVGVDLRVTLFTFGLALVGGLVCAAVPAWRSMRVGPQPLIQGRHDRASGRARIGRPMVALQVALAIVLLFGAGITARALLAILRVPLGFDPTNVIAIQVTPPDGVDDRARQAFYVNVWKPLVVAPMWCRLAPSARCRWMGARPTMGRSWLVRGRWRPASFMCCRVTSRPLASRRRAVDCPVRPTSAAALAWRWSASRRRARCFKVAIH